MTDDIEDIYFRPILNYPYARWFSEGQFNGKPMTENVRSQMVSIIDEHVAEFSHSFPKIINILNHVKEKQDEFHIMYQTVISVMVFVAQTMTDSMVISKYFVLADKDYDKRFMRGKMAVILNEGFKKLYGFETSSKSKSEWGKLKSVLHYFPEEINLQYHELTSLLEKHSTSSSWWRNDRNVETHLDCGKLYMSRNTELVEGKVMLDFLMLFDALNAVDHFLDNMHSCIHNTLTEQYLNGELKE